MAMVMVMAMGFITALLDLIVPKVHEASSMFVDDLEYAIHILMFEQRCNYFAGRTPFLAFGCDHTSPNHSFQNWNLGSKETICF